MSLTLLVGPVAVGKSVLWRELITKFDFKSFTTCTSRNPREEELAEGFIPNYTFLSREKFEEMIEKDQFFEYVEIVNNYYGTSEDSIRTAINDSDHWIGVVDINGAIDIKKAFPNVLTIFISAPSIEELKRRLEKRASESNQAQKKRIEISINEEIPNAHKLDLTIINDNIEEATVKIVESIKNFHS